LSEKTTSRSRAFSPVISAIIISAVVLAVGGAIWTFSQGAMTITAEDYAEDVIEMTEVISERFIIEMVWCDDFPITVEVLDEAVGTGDASTTVFYLDHFPVDADSEKIYVDESEQIQGEDKDYTIDYANGKITFITIPGIDLVITADYKYLTNQLDVWIFNYGLVDIEVKVQVKGVTCPAAENEWKEIPSKDVVHFPIYLDVISKEELNIVAYTKRGNNAYYKYLVP